MESTPPRYRPTTADDIPGILESMPVWYVEDEYSFDADLSRQMLQRLAGDSRMRLRSGTTSGRRSVGYLALTPGYRLESGGGDAFIDKLFVASSYRGAGLGPEIIELAERYCRSQHVRASNLEVETKRGAPAPLYERAGLERHDHTLMTP